jgi:hypothetical protein
MDTIVAIIKENMDHMPHQMRGTVKEQIDTLKFLPSGHNWKKIQTDATEVNQTSINITLPFKFSNLPYNLINRSHEGSLDGPRVYDVQIV